MRLYVINTNPVKKVYLRAFAKNKEELVKTIGSRRFKVKDKIYDVDNVIAESSVIGVVSSVTIGSIIGIVAGALGVIVGATLGYLIGYGTERQELEFVDAFNDSVYLD